MLDQLFGSKTRVALLKLFFENGEKTYYVRELTREIDAQINSVRRELENLEGLGIVKVVERSIAAEASDIVPKGLNKKRFYQLNRSFILHQELSSLFSKSHLMFEQDLTTELSVLPNLEALVMTGFFTGATATKTDLLVVGNVNRQQLSSIIQRYEEQLGREINYTIMSSQELLYRREILDRFLHDIMVNPKIVAVDRSNIINE